MNKTLLILMMFIVTLLSIQTVYASQPTNSRDIIVEYEIEELVGHMDLLVLKSELPGYYTSEVNLSFRQTHPNYESFDYLDDGEWVSFCAHIESSTCIVDYGYVIFEHVNIDVLPDVLSVIKLVYVDEDGTTVSYSDIIELPNERFYQTRNIRLYLDLQTNEFQVHVQVYTSIFFAIAIFLVLVLSVVISVVKSLIHNRQGLEPKISNKTLHYLYILLASVLTLFSIVVLLDIFSVIFLNVDTPFPAIGLIIGCFTVEAFITYFLLYDIEQLYPYIRYTVYANVAVVALYMMIIII